MALDLSKFTRRFVDEAREHLDLLYTGAARLESGAIDDIHALFRSAHTLKGSARMLKFVPISSLAHLLEDILGDLRDGKRAVTPELVTGLISGLDAIAQRVEQLAHNPDAGALLPPEPEVLATLTSLHSSSAAGSVEGSAEGAAAGSVVGAAQVSGAGSLAASVKGPAQRPGAGSDEGAAQGSGAGFRAGSVVGAAQGSAQGLQGQGSAQEAFPIRADPAANVSGANVSAATVSGATVSGATVSGATVSGAVVAEEGARGAEEDQARVRIASADSVRLPVAKLDELVRLMGEVVFSHSRSQERLLELAALERQARQSGAELATDLSELMSRVKDDVLQQGLLMQELHHKALVLRMLPISMVLEPAARSLRELARSINKRIDCRVLGGEIELDRQIIDRLTDPLVHLLRNAADHGIEGPEQREAMGKPVRGVVQLSARQDGGWVVIEIADDGVGISLPALRAKAVAKGLMTSAQADQASDQQLFSLIFEPGFSTSPIITDISGRGVGMDVVRRILVDELHGSVEITSVPGQGTTFSLRVPVSLALMRVLLVRSAGITFGFTAQQVAELIRVPEAQLVSVAERRALIRHNEFIPVVDLATLVGRGGGDSVPATAAISRGLLLIILRVREEKLALMVDDIISEQDMLIKPVPAHMSRLPLIAGLVVTGRNEVVSVLHAAQLLESVRRLRNQKTALVAATDSHAGAGWHVLVVDDSLNTREIERDVLEASGYRVTLAEDGLDGWTKAMAYPYDAVLTDVEMPHMDGFTLTSRLRGEAVYQHRPIVIITSREREEDKRRGISVGADAYIVKGEFDKNNLVDTLRTLLG